MQHTLALLHKLQQVEQQADTFNNRIQKFTDDGTFITEWQFQGIPESISIDSTNNVYVTDLQNNHIQKFTGNGTFITEWGSKGNDTEQFSIPEGVAVDSANNVYVADTNNSRIQKFAPEKIVSPTPSKP